MSEAASATINGVSAGNGTFNYTATLTDTGTTSIGTYWFAWIPGQDYLDVIPTNIVAPAGWSEMITNAGAGDGYAIQFIAGPGSDLQPGNSLSFGFTSTETPAQLAGNSSFHSTDPETTSFVYEGAPFSDAGFQLTATVTCLCAGAVILTERGEVAVEHLAIGDNVVTTSGALRPIRWLGHRRIDVSRHPDPAAVWPVRVTANAFGDGLPRRDLWLSPGHNVAVDGVIMPISALINGRSVAQVKRTEVEYWHVELDAHDILLAEGLPAESYLDCGNRTAFANGGAFVEAHPDFKPKHWAETCLPLIKEGPQVVSAKARLLARLLNQGYLVDREADAHILVDGRRIEPLRLSETRLAFVLPADGRRILLCSKVHAPAHALANSYDGRELGLAVGRLQIDGEAFSIDNDDACGSGWHAAEFDGRHFERRWTQGAAALPSGARFVIVELAGFGQYWSDPQDNVSEAETKLVTAATTILNWKSGDFEKGRVLRVGLR
jgi:hypothetical protein